MLCWYNDYLSWRRLRYTKDRKSFPPSPHLPIGCISYKKGILPVPVEVSPVITRGKESILRWAYTNKSYQNNPYLWYISLVFPHICPSLPHIFFVSLLQFIGPRNQNPLSSVKSLLHNLSFFLKMIHKLPNLTASSGFHFFSVKPPCT